MSFSACTKLSFLESSTRAVSADMREFALEPPTPPPQLEPCMLQICKIQQSKITSLRGCQGAALCCKMQVLLQGLASSAASPALKGSICTCSRFPMCLQVLPRVQASPAWAAQQTQLQLQATRVTAAAAQAA